ncbi:MAG: hypothetical protein VR65_00995 [Desulfobulbaceae bacterium BRH_c16a]|nr:MAG: hypothetical protein VR65_00995 [Desulfobulbaceae bacterium BRH_c16a]
MDLIAKVTISDHCCLAPDLIKLVAAVNERWGQPCVTDDYSTVRAVVAAGRAGMTSTGLTT